MRTTMPMLSKSDKGFTIVELLIVVVVIAILAVISIVAYSNVQQRATNAAISDAAAKTYRALQAYITSNGKYPISGGSVSACVTSGSECLGESGASVAANATFDTNMGTIATLPREVPTAGTDRKGIYIQYSSALMVESSSQPMLMVYYLAGNNQKCGLSGVMQYSWPSPSLSTTGNSSNYGTMTRCWITIPGPPHS